MIVELFSVEARTANWSTHNCSNDDKTLHPSGQSNSNWSIWMCSPKHSIPKNEKENKKINFEFEKNKKLKDKP